MSTANNTTRLEDLRNLWTGDPLDLDQLEADAARIPAWLTEVRAVTQWAHQAFGHKTAGCVGDKRPAEN